VSLRAAGASMLRVRLSRAADGGLSLQAADGSGAPVVSVTSLMVRQVPSGQLEAARGGALDAMFSVAWVPVSVPMAVPGGRWAIVGASRIGLEPALTAAGVDVWTYADLTELSVAIIAGEPVPEVVLAGAGSAAAGTAAGGRNPVGAEAARQAVQQVLGLVQRWLAEERLASSRLVVVTRDAAGPEANGTDLAGAAVCGLLRSAQTENPGRIVLADLPSVGEADGAGDAGWAALLVGALGSGEPELAVRGEIVYARRLARPSGGLVSPDPAAPRRPGTALVTGGTGTLGGLVARHLAGTGRAVGLVLASRSGPAAFGIAGLAADLAAMGADVRVVACDAGDRGRAGSAA